MIQVILNSFPFLQIPSKLCIILNKQVLLRTHGLHCEFA